MIINIETAQAMEAFGRQLGEHFRAGSRIYLQGQLGAGKTTLVRGFLRAWGHPGKVKSPSYTLVEEYELGGVNVYHFDLYRLQRAEELENIGFRDYFDAHSIVLLEWPEHAESLLEQPDLLIQMHLLAQGRRLEIHRKSTDIEIKFLEKQ